MLLSRKFSLKCWSSTPTSGQEEENENFNLDPGDERRIGVADNRLRKRQRQHIQQLFFGSDFSHRAHCETADAQLSDRFVPRRTDGLSDNIDACASYGCVGAGGGGD
jgi:hypothetical protein